MTTAQLAAPHVTQLSTVLLIAAIAAGIAAGGFFPVPVKKMVVAEAARNELPR